MMINNVTKSWVLWHRNYIPIMKKILDIWETVLKSYTDHMRQWLCCENKISNAIFEVQLVIR